MYCKHCQEQVYGSTHHCSKKGLLNVNEDDSFLVSTLIGLGTNSTMIGGLLGGSLLGGLLGDVISDGDIDLF